MRSLVGYVGLTVVVCLIVFAADFRLLHLQIIKKTQVFVDCTLSLLTVGLAICMLAYRHSPTMAWFFTPSWVVWTIMSCRYAALGKRLTTVPKK